MLTRVEVAAHEVAWKRASVALVHEVGDMAQLHRRWPTEFVSGVDGLHGDSGGVKQRHVASVDTELWPGIPRQPTQLIPVLSQHPSTLNDMCLEFS